MDVLRGLSIFGMVLSGTIPFGGALPAWMYHAQCPPPGHTFNPDVSGITWVDLVLPVFIFCMGAAIPLALHRKFESGYNFIKIMKNVGIRFVSLVLFAIYIAHILPRSIGAAKWNVQLLGFEMPGFDLQLLTLFGFILLFPLFQLIRDSKKKIIWRGIGWAGAIALLVFLRLAYGQVFSLHRGNIIILLLANVYLIGAVSWCFTRNNHKARLLLFIVWGGIQLCCKFTGFDSVLNEYQPLSWFFILRMTHYMLLLIPATIVGDILLERLKGNGKSPHLVENNIWNKLFHLGAGLLVLWLTAALFQRWMMALYLLTPLMLFGLWMIVKKYVPAYIQLFSMVIWLIVLGLILEPVEGGIKKDPATASYMLMTSGMALCLLIFLDYVTIFLAETGLVKLFSYTGKNPLLAYVMTTWFIFPLLKISFLFFVYQCFFPAGWPWIGVFRALILVLLTMMLVAWLTKKKIMWRA
ncbi:DUF5009 domain-containing protein [Labilibaculum manganireducens]|uniref:DUF5009 domain-containing protein n=1 Tax=Labilibaculum manganireducens TaxID=1940525 RepID=UPI0029F5CA04|nr:DUF5009 domain-containing protein [Labilibaculum manganireducens]